MKAWITGHGMVGLALLLGVLALAASAPDGAVSAQPASGWVFERLDQLAGPSWAVDVQGPYAYLGMGSRVEVLDLDAAPEPLKVGQLDGQGLVIDLRVAGARAFVLEAGLRLRVIDLSAAPRLTELAVLEPATAPDDRSGTLEAYGDYVYVGGSGGMAVVDLSAPRTPRRVGAVDDVHAIVDMAVSEDRLYLVSDAGALHVLSLADPSRPSLLGSLTPEEGAYPASVAVRGDTAYVTLGFWSAAAADRGEGPSGPIPDNVLLAIDVSDPARPRERARVDLSGYVSYLGDIALRGDRAYVLSQLPQRPGGGCGSPGSLQVFDLSAPADPVWLAMADAHTDAAYDLAVDGERLLLAEGHGGLRVLDAGQPDAPVLASHYDTPCHVGDVAADGDRLLLGDAGLDALWSLRAGQDGRLSPIGRSAEAQPCLSHCAAVLRGDVALAIGYGRGFRTFAIPEGAPPRLLAALEEVEDPVALAVADDHAYVLGQPEGTASPSRLTTIDVVDPARPAIAASVPVPAGAGDIAYGAGHVYVLSAEGLGVLDVRDPTAPTRVGGLVTVAGTRAHLAYGDGHLYVVDAAGALQVVDVRRPARPAVAATLPASRPDDDERPVTASDVVAGAGVVYVLRSRWLQVLGVAVPTAPRELAWARAEELGLSGWISDLALSAGRLYAGSQDGGLAVVGVGQGALVGRVHLPVAYRR